jgi:uncharacterized protein YPO0396
MDLETLAAQVADLQSKINQLMVVIPQIETLYKQTTAYQTHQNHINSVWQERSLLTQLRMEGMSHSKALSYIKRINTGEKPWENEGES